MKLLFFLALFLGLLAFAAAEDARKTCGDKLVARVAEVCGSGKRYKLMSPGIAADCCAKACTDEDIKSNHCTAEK